MGRLPGRRAGLSCVGSISSGRLDQAVGAADRDESQHDPVGAARERAAEIRARGEPLEAAEKHAEAMDWVISRFCKRWRCERWFKGWRRSDCRAIDGRS
jgi:hypothetical protein